MHNVLEARTALVSLMRHNLMRRSSPADTIRGMVGWKATQFTPRSWPSRTNLTTASVLPNMSVWLALARATWSSKDMDVGAECFLRRPETVITQYGQPSVHPVDIHPIFSSKAPRTIPNANSLIERGGNDEVFLGMELGAHDVVVVACHCAEQRAVLPVPYPDRLVVTSTDNPRELVVEEDGTNVVQVAVEGKEAAPSLKGPDLDLVVVTAGNEERL